MDAACEEIPESGRDGMAVFGLSRVVSGGVERLFSQIGIAFAAKRKSGEAATLGDIMFARINLP